MGGVQDTMNVSAVRRAFVVLLLLTTVVGFRPGTAAACSCAILDPIDAIETSDLVFTGSKVGDIETMEVVARLGDPIEVAPVEVAPVEVETGATGSGAVGTGDSDTAEERQASSSDEGRSSMGLVIGIAVLLVILVVGLQAIKRQRDEGRRSKLPPIG